MAVLTFSLSGDVVVTVSITEMLDNALKFDLAVTSETGSIGDLNGLFFDVADESLLDGMSVAGDDVTGMIFKANDVTKVDNYNNIRGELLKDLGKFDGGVQFGSQGIAEDDIRETSFILSHDSSDLTVDLFLGMDFAARLTSVGPEGGPRDGSSKIGGAAPTEPDDSGPVNIANDDSMTVSNTNGFDPAGFGDFLDGFSLSLLENDTTDEAQYIGPVTSVQGQTFTDGMIVAGSNGGLLLIKTDGSVDFSANGEFDDLTESTTDTTQFVYTIEGGDDAILTVTVFGGDDGGGGPLDNPFATPGPTSDGFEVA